MGVSEELSLKLRRRRERNGESEGAGDVEELHSDDERLPDEAANVASGDVPAARGLCRPSFAVEPLQEVGNAPHCHSRLSPKEDLNQKLLRRRLRIEASPSNVLVSVPEVGCERQQSSDDQVPVCSAEGESFLRLRRKSFDHEPLQDVANLASGAPGRPAAKELWQKLWHRRARNGEADEFLGELVDDAHGETGRRPSKLVSRGTPPRAAENSVVHVRADLKSDDAVGVRERCNKFEDRGTSRPAEPTRANVHANIRERATKLVDALSSPSKDSENLGCRPRLRAVEDIVNVGERRVKFEACDNSPRIFKFPTTSGSSMPGRDAGSRRQLWNFADLSPNNDMQPLALSPAQSSDCSHHVVELGSPAPCIASGFAEPRSPSEAQARASVEEGSIAASDPASPAATHQRGHVPIMRSPCSGRRGAVCSSVGNLDIARSVLTQAHECASPSPAAMGRGTPPHGQLDAHFSIHGRRMHFERWCQTSASDIASRQFAGGRLDLSRWLHAEDAAAPKQQDRLGVQRTEMWHYAASHPLLSPGKLQPLQHSPRALSGLATSGAVHRRTDVISRSSSTIIRSHSKVAENSARDMDSESMVCIASAITRVAAYEEERIQMVSIHSSRLDSRSDVARVEGVHHAFVDDLEIDRQGDRFARQPQAEATEAFIDGLRSASSEMGAQGASAEYTKYVDKGHGRSPGPQKWTTEREREGIDGSNVAVAEAPWEPEEERDSDLATVGEREPSEDIAAAVPQEEDDEIEEESCNERATRNLQEELHSCESSTAEGSVACGISATRDPLLSPSHRHLQGHGVAANQANQDDSEVTCDVFAQDAASGAAMPWPAPWRIPLADIPDGHQPVCQGASLDDANDSATKDHLLMHNLDDPDISESARSSQSPKPDLTIDVRDAHIGSDPLVSESSQTPPRSLPLVTAEIFTPTPSEEKVTGPPEEGGNTGGSSPCWWDASPRSLEGKGVLEEATPQREQPTMMAEIFTPDGSNVAEDIEDGAEHTSEACSPPPAPDESVISQYTEEVETSSYLTEELPDRDGLLSEPLEYIMLDYVDRLPIGLQSKVRSGVQASETLLRKLQCIMRHVRLECAKENQRRIMQRRSLGGMPPKPSEEALARSTVPTAVGLASDSIEELRKAVESLVNVLQRLNGVWKTAECRLAVVHWKGYRMKRRRMVQCLEDIMRETDLIEQLLPIHDKVTQFANDDCRMGGTGGLVPLYIARFGLRDDWERYVEILRGEVEFARVAVHQLGIACPGVIDDSKPCQRAPARYERGVLCAGRLCK